MTRLMKMTICLLCVLLSISWHLTAQRYHAYTTQQAHSHHDYMQKEPFWEAYRQGFGSIEIDLVLDQNRLYVASDSGEILTKRTLEALYIGPIQEIIDKNSHEKAFPVPLQLLINLHSDAIASMEVLTQLLAPLEEQLAPKGCIQIVISGQLPSPTTFAEYPLFFYFDGRPEWSYTKYQLMRIALISQNFQKYTRWNGEGDMPRKDRRRIAKTIDQVHHLGKPIRFWATPDNINTWKKLMELRVDFLNTNRVVEMGDYLNNAPRD